jgi:hypothetical protein
VKLRWHARQGCAFVQDLMRDGQITASIWHIGPARWRVFVRRPGRRALAEVGSEQNQRAAKASAMRELGHA